VTGEQASVDVLVVGAGPAGSAVAATVAASGHRVIVVDRADTPGGKPCGELLTPRALVALDRCGITHDRLAGYHPVTHVRFTTGTASSAARWPGHEEQPDHGLVAPRELFDAMLVEHAVDAGATVLGNHEATDPIVERGFVRGARVIRGDGTTTEIRATFTVVADGANSRFGRALGTYRQPRWPSALAHRAIYASSLHDAAEIELVVDLEDRAGTPITGYGWMFPRGDGTANVGVLMMSTSPSFQVVNPARLLDRFVADNSGRWRLHGDPVHPPAGGRVPMGASVRPAAGPTYLVVGDAAGVANPFSGAGIEYAVETGVLAGGVLDEALRTGQALSLQRYPKLIDERYGTYFKVGRLVDRVLGRPALARRVGSSAAASPAFARSLIRVSANALRARHPGATEMAYRMGAAISTVVPDA
jgi:geranylgeranyl reductase family protein